MLEFIKLKIIPKSIRHCVKYTRGINSKYKPIISDSL